jgi:3-oxoacyl-(acyl-carrier-protein) synthase/NAD(P)-dependent dehydrogenase (short-subunit alcohol dehydrogenase family)/acyl carrier protein
VVQLIQELQHLLQSRPAVPAASPLEPVLVQVVVAHRQEPSFLEALAGMLKTVRMEYPKLVGQLIEVEREPGEKELLACLRENQRVSQESRIYYRDGKRWVREWQEVETSSATASVKIPWKEGGCYLITGGAGGLARLFVQDIAQQVQEATIILVGRSALSAPWPLATDGIRIDYQQVDVRDRSAVHALFQRILRQYGHLNGIIHSAGVLHDSLLLNKTPEDVRAVLAPKVIGVELLDEASAEIPLEFFVLCSSLAAVAGNVGQSDYAAANAYLDTFAHARQTLVATGERQGTTVSINWPLWEEGGMQVEASKRQMMRERLGLEVLETKTGMKMFYQALASGHAQVIVLHGRIERIKDRLWHRSPEFPAEAGRAQDTRQGPRLSAPTEGGTDPGREVELNTLCEALTYTISRVAKIQAEKINTETDLSEYGFDSVTFTQLANRLNQTYKLDLTPTLFYEHSTIERLTQYLQTTYATILAPHFTKALPVAPGMTSQDLASIASKTTSEELAGTPVPRWRFRLAYSHMQIPEQKEPATTEPIAIIGISGCFPQAPDLQSLWNNLLEGRDCISEIPSSRWDWQTSFGNTATEINKTNIKWAGLIEGVELFDPQFFGISPREAQQMDPQQRLLMMYVWKAIEDAGYSAESLSGTNTALFVGTASSGYSERVFNANTAIEGYSATGLASSVGPNRMSYFLNLHGPSEPIDTACSSSLVAIHRGVNAIGSGQCDMAIVGGVNALVSPELHISFSKAGMLSEDGHCKTFSAQANGYVRGEGVGMLVLKRLSDAEQDGDHIYGVIRGSAENHGGRASSFTAPNPRAQADVLIAAYRKTGIDPRTVGYIEAHGTGTELGDPIEINGLKTAFSELIQSTGEGPMPQASCGIGSVKSNIGHLELAAGVAGVIKVLLQMQHKQLVKSLHCEQINSYIQLESSPFYIVQENREWEALQDREGNLLPRRAGVSSFGFGGVNAHVVLEEYVSKGRTSRSGAGDRKVGEGWPLSSMGASPTSTPRLLIVLSARNEARLYEQVQQLLGRIQAGRCTEEELLDLAYTLQVGRTAMEERLALQVSSLVELEEKLRRYLQEPQQAGGWHRGQVKQYKEMVSLFSTNEELQEAIDKWLQRGKYEKLLQGWVKGLVIDWKRLYGEQLPRRISLPTYPFAQERYWIPLPEDQCPAPTIETNGNGKASNPAGLHSIALRPLRDHPQSQLSIALSSPSQPFSQSTGNDLVVPVSMPDEPHTPVAQDTGSAQGTITMEVRELEEELIRSLAQTLYIEQSAVDVEKPFVEMGLDSVVGVEWIQSLNKQYASNLKASSVYDYPTIRQLAGFLEKDLRKRHQMPIKPLPVLSLDDVLQQLQQGAFDIGKAEQLVHQVFTQAKKEDY